LFQTDKTSSKRGTNLELGIADRTALVLGAAGGLGSAIARKLAAERVRVVLADRDEAALRSLADALVASGARASCMPCELGDRAGVASALAGAEASAGPIDILVNNTGGPPPGSILGQSAATWGAHFESMVMSVIHLSDLLVPGMRERRWGRVITSTSSGVIAPIPQLGLSNSLRSALVGWSKTLAAEVAADGVTVNITVPGRIATARIRQLDEAKARRDGIEAAEVSRASIGSIPARRYGDPDEYASVVTFLASAPASYVTGSVIRVDGGLIASV
jgi:3-oxoacyl-[acyl-carrier protein] reductase